MQNERTNIESIEQKGHTTDQEHPNSSAATNDGGEVNQQQPSWRPGEDPAGVGQNDAYHQAGEEVTGRNQDAETGDTDILSSRGQHSGGGGF